MTTEPETPGQQRIPGVRYRKVLRERDETTVIDGIPSTRRVPYDTWEPVPPRDWDEIITRGVTGVTVLVLLLALAGTTASVGGLLGSLIPRPLAYLVGIVFSLTWISCMAVEWLQTRSSTGGAFVPRAAGWLALVISMTAAATYGHTRDQLAAGIIGASVDLLAKGLATLVIGLYRVDLDPGVAHWFAEQEQKMAGRILLGARLNRLSRRDAYMRAVGDRGHETAGAILATAAQQRPAPAPVPGPAPRTTPAPSAKAPEAPRTAPAPAAPVPPPAAPEPDTGSRGDVLDMKTPVSQLVRKALTEDPAMDEADILARVQAVHGTDNPKLPETVARYLRKQRKAS